MNKLLLCACITLCINGMQRSSEWRDEEFEEVRRQYEAQKIALKDKYAREYSKLRAIELTEVRRTVREVEERAEREKRNE